MNSNMVKPEKFGHLHLVYHFTIPLTKGQFTQNLKNGSDIYELVHQKNLELSGFLGVGNNWGYM